ncbi:MAG: ATP-binding protein, partial [Streptomyces sp.]|nr:ATP-binding protein [Streptomyces sp.]
DDAAFIPKARNGEADADPGAGGARPLRRRVRGATLRTTSVSEAERQALLKSAPPADAAAVRDALEEFEAAVARAHLDSDTGSHAAPQRPDTPDVRAAAERAQEPRTPDHGRNNLPEGAEQ